MVGKKSQLEREGGHNQFHAEPPNIVAKRLETHHTLLVKPAGVKEEDLRSALKIVGGMVKELDKLASVLGKRGSA